MSRPGTFKKGHEGLKKKGTKNKATVEVEGVIKIMVAYLGEPGMMREVLDSVKEKSPHVLVNFMGRICPKDINVKHDKPFAIVYMPKEEVEKE